MHVICWKKNQWLSTHNHTNYKSITRTNISNYPVDWYKKHTEYLLAKFNVHDCSTLIDWLNTLTEGSEGLFFKPYSYWSSHLSAMNFLPSFYFYIIYSVHDICGTTSFFLGTILSAGDIAGTKAKSLLSWDLHSVGWTWWKAFKWMNVR